MSYRSGIGMPLVRGGMCHLHDGDGGDYGEVGSFPYKIIYNLIALEIVVGSNFLEWILCVVLVMSYVIIIMRSRYG
jgi:hypothetical protein